MLKKLLTCFFLTTLIACSGGKQEAPSTAPKTEAPAAPSTPPTSEAKPAEAPKAPAAIEGKLTAEQVTGSIVPAMCKKMITCQPKAMPDEAYCTTTLQEALKKTLEANPKANAEPTQKQLDDCVASIQKTECSGLMGAKAPQGCEFLDQAQ